MKRFTYVFILLLSVSATAQSLYIETGKTDSSFEFTNSNGVELNNLQHVTKSYVEAGYRRNILTEGLNIGLGLSYNSYGAVGSDDALNNYFEYNVDYLGINFGFDYTIFHFENIGFYVKAGGSYEHLVQGTQIVNNSVRNLTNDGEEFDAGAIFYRGGAGFSFPLSEKTKIYAQYMYGQSLGLNDSSNSGSSEELKYITHMVGIGLQVNFPPKAPKEEIEIETED